MRSEMEPLTVITFKWKSANYRSTFTSQHVNILRNMVERNYNRPHRFVCVTDDAAGLDPRVEAYPLWNDYASVKNPMGAGNPSCYRRLKLFSLEAREMFGPRLVSLDLDCVIAGDMVPVWDRREDFVIWGRTNDCSPYNGSMFLLRTGTRTKVWNDFDPKTSPMESRRKRYFGSDQAWIAVALGEHEPRWGVPDGVLSFRIDLKQRRIRHLPNFARVVFFHGQIDPWSPGIPEAYPWIKEHWR